MPKSSLVTFDELRERLIKPPHIVYKNNVLSQISKLISIQEFVDLSKRLIRQLEIKLSHQYENSSEDSIKNVLKILTGFHKVKRQLQNRHESRNTIEINDEYDVQDLLHALLKIFVDDVRPEEWTPSCAGSSNRMDFLLKKEKIVIEVKMTRLSLKEKQIGEQLLVDIAKYKEHQDCKTLICFVYDPTAIINNPQGLEDDLNSNSTDSLEVIAVIQP